MEDRGVLDAFLDSAAVPLTTKRRLACLNHEIGTAVASHFNGELKVVHVHLADCTLDNADFVLHTLFPKNFRLVLSAHDERFQPELDLGEVVERVRRARRFGSRHFAPLASVDGERRMNYATAYFLGHLLVDHCLGDDPYAHPITSGHAARLSSRTDLGLFSRFAAKGCNAERAILHATMLRTAGRSARLESHVLLKNMGLDNCILSKIAPMLHTSARCRFVNELVLEGNAIGERGARALFGAGVEWPHLTRLVLDRNRLGCAGCGWLFSAIRDGCMPELESLHLGNVELDDQGARSMWHELAKLRNLERLDASMNPFGYDGLAQLLLPMIGQWFPKLKSLNVAPMDAATLHCARADRTLARAVLEGRFPALARAAVHPGWEGAQHALELLCSERASRRWRAEMKRWAESSGDEAPPPKRFVRRVE